MIGFLIENPLLMSVWLTSSVFFLVSDVFTWAFEIITNGTGLRLATILSELCYLCTVLLVGCVRDVFQAQPQHDTRHLHAFC